MNWRPLPPSEEPCERMMAAQVPGGALVRLETWDDADAFAVAMTFVPGVTVTGGCGEYGDLVFTRASTGGPK
jgi:hypothetical protein